MDFSLAAVHDAIAEAIPSREIVVFPGSSTQLRSSSTSGPAAWRTTCSRRV